jgi:D-arabinose 1-dehydrogenase-like Zn-dependent alcohol dehydrogenase
MPDQGFLRVRACGACHPDLRTVEGEPPRRRQQLIPGHQIVGNVGGATPELPQAEVRRGSAEICDF